MHCSEKSKFVRREIVGNGGGLYPRDIAHPLKNLTYDAIEAPAQFQSRVADRSYARLRNSGQVRLSACAKRRTIGRNLKHDDFHAFLNELKSQGFIFYYISPLWFWDSPHKSPFLAFSPPSCPRITMMRRATRVPSIPTPEAASTSGFSSIRVQWSTHRL